MNAFLFRTLALLLESLIAALEEGMGEDVILLLSKGLRNLVGMLNDEDTEARGIIADDRLDQMTDTLIKLQETVDGYKFYKGEKQRER